MNIQGAGMVPPGKWVNKINGNEVYVRDSFIDGDQMVIMTDKGQLTMKEFTNYIQCEEGEVIPTLADLYGKKDPSLLQMINRGIDKEDQIPVNKTNSNISTTTNTTTNIATITIDNKNIETKPINKNYDLIKKVFDKFPVERTINFEIVEDEWPFKEFNMLVNILDVPLKDICEYVIDTYFDKEKLSKQLSKYFENHIQ